MDSLSVVLESLRETSVSAFIRDSFWVFPTIETAHIFGIIMLVGSASAFDMRLLGITLNEQPFSRVYRLTRPWSYAGLSILITTGLLMFMSEPVRYIENPIFLVKMILIALAGLNVLVFTLTIYRTIDAWDVGALTPSRAKIAGALSLLFWSCVVIAGRWIAFY